MTGLLSTISGKFGQMLILGTFAPVSVFVLLLLITVLPLVPPDYPPVVTLTGIETQWKVVIVTAATIMMSLLLYNLNIPLIRLYEGYPWRATPLGRRRVRHYQAKFKSLQARRVGLRALIRAMDRSDAVTRQNALEDQHGPKRTNKYLAKEHWPAAASARREAQWEALLGVLRAARTAVEVRARTEFPSQADLVLPTRLGNVIRAFEDYPATTYKMDAVALWPRLIASIDKDYASGIDDAKTAFDFFLNASFLNVLLAAIILGLGLVHPAQLASPSWFALWVLEMAALLAVGYTAYVMSIGRAAAWGDTVKSAFDLYRGALLKHSGTHSNPRPGRTKQHSGRGSRRTWFTVRPPRGLHQATRFHRKSIRMQRPMESRLKCRAAFERDSGGGA
jgi:hypothetical protein